ncbi:MAG TPA: 1-deoxy-D-xylulose-5-phosphate synthase [Candidatus Latescibacteria bacterium]|nr:1-deoxy-D-xylulose-5-phosphate synthase [Candidatus Latescibacterota bacterium]
MPEALLDSIDGPEDLKKLTVPELEQLAGEIRERIISVVSRTGGHLAPSLGAVELALALHYVLDAPRDKIIWDVGHQAYAHKLITGRREQFPTLRQYGGISGFTKRFESPYDPFGAGHASTSISAALGFACARDMAGEDYKIVAVIGDGALTGGLAYEGINNAGALKKDLLVILNDNQMSISPNVGAISRVFTDFITAQVYNRLKNDIWELTGRLASLGEQVRRIVRRIDQSLKALIVPGIFFERLGFRYFGPIDGHDLPYLISVLQQVKDLHGPILVHVYTVKGKGYKPAEEDATTFHGVGKFDPETGVSIKGEGPSYSDVFGRSLAELAEGKERVVAITAAMKEGTGLKYFAERFPERFYDVGIAESHAVVFAAGLAAAGMRPVAAIYSTFLQRALDPLIHDVALQKLPVVFAIDRAGIVGDDGPTHNGTFDIVYLRMVPDMVVMAPKHELELKAMLLTALEYEDGPIALRYPRGRGLGVDFSGEVESLPIGRAEVLREGRDGTIWAVGSMVYPSLEAANLLDAKGLSFGVVNARFVKPLDSELLLKSAQMGPIVTVEEGALTGGFGSAVLEHLEGFLSARVLRLGIPDRFIEQGKRDELLKMLGLDGEGIARSIEKWL